MKKFFAFAMAASLCALLASCASQDVSTYNYRLTESYGLGSSDRTSGTAVITFENSTGRGSLELTDGKMTVNFTLNGYVEYNGDVYDGKEGENGVRRRWVAHDDTHNRDCEIWYDEFIKGDSTKIYWRYIRFHYSGSARSRPKVAADYKVIPIS